MAQKYPMIAAAVAAALTGYANAAPPTVAQAAAAAGTLVIAGSSAAQTAVTNAVENDICGGSANTLVVKSSGGSGNFTALSCQTANAVGSIPSGTIVTIYYRTEGGSVVGALPLVQGHQVKRLDLTQCTAGAVCTVNGVTATSGPNDSWTGAVTEDFVQLGITDVEPGQLTGADSPLTSGIGTPYATTAFGNATPAQLAALSTVRLFDQVFGLVVNTSGESFSTLNISKQTAANILLGLFTDWSGVPDASSSTGAPLSSAAAPITHVDREPGSGTRTATNIFFLNYQCGATQPIAATGGEVLNYSTTDELTLANSTKGSIAYTSIDQIQNPANGTKFPNLALFQIDGVTPSNWAAATGSYGFWFEATAVPATTPAVTGNSAQISTFLQGDMPKLARAPASPDILVIPGIGGNVGAVPFNNNGQTGTAEIYVNPYTRGGGSCNVPQA
jgi:ABC-type phosphate transport system substrate-binding protein